MKGVRLGGRAKGTPNKTTQQIRELARVEGPANIAALAAFRDDPSNPVAARIEAIKELLNRGYGRPSQEVLLQMDVSVVYARLSDAELADRCEAIACRLRADAEARLSLPEAIDVEPAP